MGTTSGGCSFTSWTLEGAEHASSPMAALPCTLPTFPGERPGLLPAQGVPDVLWERHTPVSACPLTLGPPTPRPPVSPKTQLCPPVSHSLTHSYTSDQEPAVGCPKCNLDMGTLERPWAQPPCRPGLTPPMCLEDAGHWLLACPPRAPSTPGWRDTWVESWPPGLKGTWLSAACPPTGPRLTPTFQVRPLHLDIPLSHNDTHKHCTQHEGLTVSLESKCWRPNPQGLRTGLDLEMGTLQKWFE